MSQETFPRMTAFIKKIETECLPGIERHTVGIWTVQDDQVRHDRSGVLYAIADRHFILTASHVGDDGRTFADAINAQIPLYVSRGELDSLPVPLCGPECWFRGTEASKRSARDICAIELDLETVEHLKATKAFLRHDRVGHNDDGQGWYMIVGYPRAWTTGCPTGVAEKPLAYFSTPYEGSFQVDSIFDPNVHVALNFTQDGVEIKSGTGVRLPRIHGVSGCGIWRIADPKSSALGGWSPKQVRLVAIQHSWNKERRFVLGTWIKYVTGRILDEHPDLNRSMNLVYPRSDRI
ncbi:MAG: hypothetical protein FLDDKLPJ_01588 [Phycisphaerae bacterium]|nr:hypothetical protein [Phycisphaerae bacterium]